MSKFKNCYLCKHCERLPDSAYSKCVKAEPVTPKTKKKMSVKVEPYGVLNGWCDWPYRFDPVWVNDCKFFDQI